MVLEIGAGDSPHLEYLKHDFDEYHIIETSDFAINQNFDNSKIKISKYDGKKIPYQNDTFDCPPGAYDGSGELRLPSQAREFSGLVVAQAAVAPGFARSHTGKDGFRRQMTPLGEHQESR